MKLFEAEPVVADLTRCKNYVNYIEKLTGRQTAELRGLDWRCLDVEKKSRLLQQVYCYSAVHE